MYVIMHFLKMRKFSQNEKINIIKSAKLAKYYTLILARYLQLSIGKSNYSLEKCKGTKE